MDTTDLRQKLASSGVCDLKFCFNLDTKSSRAASAVKEEVHQALKLYLAGEYVRDYPVGELTKKQAI